MYYINVSVFRRLFLACVPSAEDDLCGSLVIENVLAKRKRQLNEPFSNYVETVHWVSQSLMGSI